MCDFFTAMTVENPKETCCRVLRWVFIVAMEVKDYHVGVLLYREKSKRVRQG
jgi:hypothetical protein